MSKRYGVTLGIIGLLFASCSGTPQTPAPLPTLASIETAGAPTEDSAGNLQTAAWETVTAQSVQGDVFATATAGVRSTDIFVSLRIIARTELEGTCASEGGGASCADDVQLIFEQYSDLITRCLNDSGTAIALRTPDMVGMADCLESYGATLVWREG